MYHYHQQPALLRQQFGDDGSHHSPLLGFAFDGFPVYGPYGYANTDGTGGIDRMEPSYRLRNLTTRTNGPAVSTTFPLGYYVEDYEYVAGVGDLDAYNGRFAITPEYPAGTYAYFTTVDASGNAAYPYIVGTSFYGVLQNDNRTQPVSVPAGVSTFTAAASGTWSNANGGEWCTNANWAGGTAPAGVATMASFGEMSGKSDVAVEVDSPLRVGTMNFSGASKYAIGGIGMITVVGTTASNVNVGSGAHVITAPVALGKATTFNVSSGASLDVNNLESVGVAITKSGAGTLKLGRLSGTALTVSQGTVQMPAGGSMLKVNTLSIAPGAKLDLGDRDLVVNNGSFTTIRSLVIQGANGSEGITSSSDQSCILALFDNALVGASTWELQAIGANAVVGKHTYFGDVNLDGQVSGDDYTVIDATLNSDPAPGLEWLSGDMNIDGIVTGDDYTVIDANLGLGAGNALVMSGLTAVPDP
jgi:hypothetical protein